MGGDFATDDRTVSKSSLMGYILANYMPALVWLISAIVCAYIANKRGVRKTALRSIIVALLGPLAIPLALVVEAENTPPVEHQN